jgi:hypothetical protein
MHAYKDKDPDDEDIEFISEHVCAICSRKLFPGELRHRVDDVVICQFCWCD